MDKSSKGQRKLEDWRRAISCSGRTEQGSNSPGKKVGGLAEGYFLQWKDRAGQ